MFHFPADVCRTGEVPWVRDMIRKYHDTAVRTGAIVRLTRKDGWCLGSSTLQMLPQMGFESVPADILAWLIICAIRVRFSAGTEEVILSVHDIK